jgi:hypothetical protein
MEAAAVWQLLAYDIQAQLAADDSGAGAARMLQNCGPVALAILAIVAPSGRSEASQACNDSPTFDP